MNIDDPIGYLGCLEINYLISIDILKKAFFNNHVFFDLFKSSLEKDVVYDQLSDIENIVISYSKKNKNILFSICIRPWNKLSNEAIKIMNDLNNNETLFFTGFELLFDIDNIEETIFNHDANYPILLKRNSNEFSIFDKFNSKLEIKIIKNILEPVFSKI